MKKALLDFASRYVFYPLWDIRDRSPKLREWRRLEKSQWRATSDRSAEQWKRLTAIVDEATAHCPFYRARTKGPIGSYEDFLQVPLLSKDQVRQHKSELVSDLFPRESLVSAKTGGSTGVSLEVLFDSDCQAFRNAAALRSDIWSGWSIGQERGALWGNPPVAVTFKQKARSALLDRLVYLDTVEMSDAAMATFLDSLKKRKIEVLYGHAHSLFVFASYVASKGGAAPRIRGIISTSMMLLPNERQVIERVFNCKVTNRYGCEEVGLIASECEVHEGLHLNTDHLFVEFLNSDGRPAKPGEEGMIVVTDLINRGMPLIRYVVGDVGVPSTRTCRCGRTLPMMERVVGRTADFLVKKDGSLVAGVSLVERTLTAIPGIAQLQIVQENLDDINLNLVPDSKFTNEAEQRLLAEMHSVFGDVQIKIRRGTALDQEKNGKYRFAICRVQNRYQQVAS